VSTTINNTQEASAAFGLKNAMPIERKKMASIARFLKKWKLANTLLGELPRTP